MEFFIIFAMVWAVMRRSGDTSASGGGSRSGPAGGPRLPQYGWWDHRKDLYRDGWRRETDRAIARRDERDARRAAGEPEPPGWWRRQWNAAEDRVATRQAARRPRSTGDTTPRTQTTAVPPTSGGQSPHATGAPAPATKTTPHPGPPKADPPAPSAETTPETQPEPRRLRLVHTPTEPPDDKPTEGQPAPTTPEPSTNEGDDTTMGAPAVEVTDHESHIANIDATLERLRKLRDKIDEAKGSADTTLDLVDQVQAEYGPVAEATTAQVEQLQGLNVDATTTGHAAEASDALSPNLVVAHADATEAVVEGLKKAAELVDAAIASKENERREAIDRYADAQETVNTNLGGSAEYLNSGGSNPSGRSGPAATAAIEHEHRQASGADPNYQPVSSR